MSRTKKILLVSMLGVIVTLHVGLFAAGGNWRTLGFWLVAFDVLSGLFIVGAIREFKKLDQKKD